MSAADPLQEVSDLKRKLRLIKNKLLDPTERNVRQAINMIDDTFATEEIHLNCSRYVSSFLECSYVHITDRT